MLPLLCHVLFMINAVLFLLSSLHFFVLDSTVYRANPCVFVPSDISGMAFQLSPLSDKKLQWFDDVKKHLQETSLGRKIDDKVHSLRPLYTLGRFNAETEIYLPSSMDDPEKGSKFPSRIRQNLTRRMPRSLLSSYLMLNLLYSKNS